jgi:hypothetical protein
MPKPKIVQSICHSVAMIGAFASLAVLPETALAQNQGSSVTVVNPATRPVPTTVLNPSTAPVPTTVLNPATNPALTRNVDDPGRIAYQQHADLSGDCISGQLCQVPFSSVPMGHRLVIQHFSFHMSTFGSASAIISHASATLRNSTSSNIDISTVVGGFGGFVAANQPVLLYTDGGNLPILFVSVHSPSPDASFAGAATIMGYLLDCSVTPCNPIAG